MPARRYDADPHCQRHRVQVVTASASNIDASSPSESAMSAICEIVDA